MALGHSGEVAGRLFRELRFTAEYSEISAAMI
jgi:hypothetical protein